jgi:predicted double-glycine peptidase
MIEKNFDNSCGLSLITVIELLLVKAMSEKVLKTVFKYKV